jgi:hypothetical protein
MRILLIFIIVIMVGGVLLLGSMFARDDSRLGIAGLAVLMTADVMAMVYAAMNQ